MSNVHGLFSNRKNDDDSDDDHNNRFVGGIDSRGGGRCVQSAERDPRPLEHCLFLSLILFSSIYL